SPEAIRAFFRRLHSSIGEVPGVEYASVNWGAHPMEGDNETRFWAEGQPRPARDVDFPQTLEYIVEPDYLQTMRIPLLRGLYINDGDTEHSVRVAVIDNTFAEKYFPGQDPIGKHVSLLDYDRDSSHRVLIPLLVVGVVGHVNQFGLA